MKYIHNFCCLIVVALLFRAGELVGLRTDFAMLLLGILFYSIIHQVDKWDDKLPWLYQKGEYIINYLTISIACLSLAILNALFGVIAKFAFNWVIVIILALGIIIFSLIELYRRIRISRLIKLAARPLKLSDLLLYMVGYPSVEIIAIAIIVSFLPF